MASLDMRFLAAVLVVTAPGLAAAQPIEVQDPAIREVVAHELPPGTVLGRYAPQRHPPTVPLLTPGTSVFSMMAPTGFHVFIAAMSTGTADVGCPPASLHPHGATRFSGSWGQEDGRNDRPEECRVSRAASTSFS